jgi:hypothetical protein
VRILILKAFLLISLLSLSSCSKSQQAMIVTNDQPPANTVDSSKSTNQMAMDAHQAHNKAKKRVPAFQTDKNSLKKLPPTLSPKKFTGTTRKAYQVAKDMPEVLAQLPCYCYCDQAHGHKSLHTCYTDDHSANCGICIDEALMADRLYKEEKLSVSQIRERIMQEFSK